MENYKSIYPITYIGNVIHEETKENLYAYLSQFNHINLGYVPSKEFARNSIPAILRKQGLYITYYINNDCITEYYNGNKNLINEADYWFRDEYWIRKNDFLSGGATEFRPGDAPVGLMFYDTTIKRPVWWNGAEWKVDEINIIVNIKEIDIINTRRRVMLGRDLSKIPDNVSGEYPPFDEIKELAFYGDFIYLIDKAGNYYHNGYNVELAGIIVHKYDKYYYLEKDKSLTLITEENIDNYILPIYINDIPSFGSINPYANGTMITIDRGYEIMFRVAFPTQFRPIQ